jgi:hypothetical protein
MHCLGGESHLTQVLTFFFTYGLVEMPSQQSHTSPHQDNVNLLLSEDGIVAL